MKVIDKRTERNNDWHIGDVICYWNKPDEKYYGLICEIKLPTDSGVGVIDLENKTKRKKQKHRSILADMELNDD